MTQCLSGLLDGKSTYITKLVECPVVDKVPRRALVLYTGLAYVGFGVKVDFSPGIIHICKKDGLRNSNKTHK